jgi:hypothetical protein
MVTDASASGSRNDRAGHPHAGSRKGRVADVLARLLTGCCSPEEQKSSDADRAFPTRPHRNDLDRVASLRAEYRDVGEAGVLAPARRDLLVAKRRTRDRCPEQARGHFPIHERAAFLPVSVAAGRTSPFSWDRRSSRSRSLTPGAATNQQSRPRPGAAGGVPLQECRPR